MLPAYLPQVPYFPHNPKNTQAVAKTVCVFAVFNRL